MAKVIKDIIHLYLGCDCQYGNEVGGMYEVDKTGVRLKGVFGGGHIDKRLVKPLLYRLSDMTEEDQQNFSEEQLDSYSVDEARFSVEQVIFLLSKGYDLFGLIDAGLAHDKKQYLNQK